MQASKPAVPTLFGTRGWFCGRRFFHGQAMGVYGMIQAHFSSIIITSAPPQIIRHQIAEVVDPCYTP